MFTLDNGAAAVAAAVGRYALNCEPLSPVLFFSIPESINKGNFSRGRLTLVGKRGQRERRRKEGGERLCVASAAHESLREIFHVLRATCFRRKRRPGSNRFETRLLVRGKLRFYLNH